MTCLARSVSVPELSLFQSEITHEITLVRDIKFDTPKPKQGSVVTQAAKSKRESWCERTAFFHRTYFFEGVCKIST